jgi:aspartate aminotransferase-like enzyme
VDSNLFKTYRLMAPGPVPLHPDVQSALSLPMIHHRTPLFDQILKRVLVNLKKVFQTEENVYILSGTGSAGMEACLVNVLSPGDEVLCIVSGKFGERWAEMSSQFGHKVHSLNVEWGHAVDPLDVEKILNENPQIKAVLCQACETSTAVLHPIQELGEIVSRFDHTLFLVDGITAVGATEMPMDAWKIDGLVAGSQKAFMLPTGMSFLSFSKKAQSRFNLASTPRYYLDIRKEKAANEKGESFFSSSVTLIRALDKALDIMLAQPMEEWLGQIKRRADFTNFATFSLRLDLYSHSPSPSLTALKVPSQVDGNKWRLRLEEKYNLTVMGGQDQLKGLILRIGHMGYITDLDLLAMAQALYHSLEDVNIELPLGAEQFWIHNQKWLELHK